MKRKPSYRLTNGTEATNIEAYLADWQRFRDALGDLGLRVVAFDPALTVCDAGSNGGTFTLPIYAAKRLLNLD